MGLSLIHILYDPNSSATPDYIREGINSILNNPDAEKSVKDYIRKSFGKVAERDVYKRQILIGEPSVSCQLLPAHIFVLTC